MGFLHHLQLDTLYCLHEPDEAQMNGSHLGAFGHRKVRGVADRYLTKRPRHVMILFKLGYGSREMTMLKVNSKNRYPEAFDAFWEELEAL